MEIAEWWPKLTHATRDWLLANNGDAVPAEIMTEIAAAGGPGKSEPWWTNQIDSDGFYFPDDASDWVEAVANDERPS
ncbi:hypothetical protein B0I08_104163 [Glaciihabitans tibetensis]|uniref:Uncharacterized protein n=1 Tax=Glaciihabitans tibetensis TaxID=1266600 RepID=A0A2T0VE58_9MICO|nr:hypothetical protein [Glaciihabitans tibetensis]PRY68461.1 hypothetical protein B0I08_104163 [Glaciihabitans tibetensis]